MSVELSDAAGAPLTPDAKRGREWDAAMKDEQCAYVWRKGGRGDPLTYDAMADRAEEMGLLLIAAYWRASARALRRKQAR